MATRPWPLPPLGPKRAAFGVAGEDLYSMLVRAAEDVGLDEPTSLTS